MDNAMEASETLKTKWILFTRLLAAIQGTSPISVFHASGFDERGNFRGLPPKDPGENPVLVELPEIPEEVITSVIRDFLKTVGMEEITEDVSGALQKEVKNQPTPTSPVFEKLNSRQLSSLGQKEQIAYLAEEFLDDIDSGRASLEDLSQAKVTLWLKRRENRV